MLPVIVILGVVEGLTEFLPISSTGHLVVAASLLGFDPEWREPFLVVIQLGAILAVIVDRRAALAAIARSGRIVRMAGLLALGFTPSAALAFLFSDRISGLLRSPTSVATAWIVGGFAILLIDRPRASRIDAPPLVEGLDRPTADRDAFPGMTYRQALLVGLAQCLSLWPGVSRSGSTILGGLVVGLDRPTATLLSFYLAIPTMVAASGYELLKFRHALSGAAVPFAVGMLVSFLVAWATVRWLLRWVQTHTFRPFAAYRILVGVALLVTASR